MIRRTLYLVVLILALLLVPSHITARARGAIVHATAPVTKPLSALNRRFDAAIESFREIPRLSQRNASLQNQVVSLQEQLLRQGELAQENASLRQELGVSGVARQTAKVLAHVTVQGSDPLDKTLDVDVGTSQGIQAGQPAVYQGVLIGRVIQAESFSATVRLLISNKSVVQARINPGTGAATEDGLISGDGDAITLTDIQQGSNPVSKTPVETSGLGGSLPQGILIGSLAGLVSKPSDLSQSYQVSMPYDPDDLDSFFILLTTPSS
jgi:rod shape-determining protein MreC